MLQSLLRLVRGYAQDVIVDNSAVPNEHNDAAIQETLQSLLGGLKGAINSGNMGGVMELMNGSDLSQNSIVLRATSILAASLSEKFSVSPEQAELIAKRLVPQVLKGLVERVSDPEDHEFTLPGLVGSVAGGNFGNLDVSTLLGAMGGAAGLSGLVERTATPRSTETALPTDGISQMFQGLMGSVLVEEKK